MSILLLVFFSSPTIQNVGIHYAGTNKIPEDVLPCFKWEVANIIFHAHLIMMVYTIHMSVVQLNVLWLINFDQITIQSPVYVNNISWISLHIDKGLLLCQTVSTDFELPSWYDL